MRFSWGLLFLFLFSADTLACKCTGAQLLDFSANNAPEIIETAFQNSSVVALVYAEHSEEDERELSLKVLKLWKGDPNLTDIPYSLTGDSCQYWPRDDSISLVFMTEYEDHGNMRLYSSNCSANRMLPFDFPLPIDEQLDQLSSTIVEQNKSGLSFFRFLKDLF